MTDQHTNLILQLCFDGSLPPFYDGSIVNLLSGESFEVDYTKRQKKKRFGNFYIVSDIPDYLNVRNIENNHGLTVKKIDYYKGYSVNLKEYSNIEELLGQKLKRNTRKNLRSKLRKLESDYNVQYKFYYGHIDKKQYDHLFDVCYTLMEKRFRQKKIYNRFLVDWDFFHRLFLPKILKKEASLFVIYNGEKPITITLNFHRTDIIFSFIQIYDVKYHKFSLGDIAMYKNLEWSYNHGISIWDVSKGVTSNKLRWCNHIYTFEYHLFYDPNSFIARFKVFMITGKLIFKQFLREKKIINNVFQLDKLYYYTKMRRLKNHDWKKS